MSEGRTAFLIADVSGKGLGAALLTTMLQGALSGMTLGNDPVKVFNHVNRFLCDHAEVGRYATMFFGVLDSDGHMEFINAGHPSPILIRKDSVEEAFTEGSYPCRSRAGYAEYTAACLKLEPEDTLVLFSDGVTEAMDPDEHAFWSAVGSARRDWPARPTCNWKKCKRACWKQWRISLAARGKRMI
jgi:sigma-B regulation protein RsbU (phosphoserine phosphatase)